MKKRILFISDSIKRKTGYATVARNIIQRLVKSEKYEIAQLGLADAPATVNLPIHYYSAVKIHDKCCQRGKVIEYVAPNDPTINFLKLEPNVPLHENQHPCIQGRPEDADNYGYISVYYVIQHFRPDIVIPINDVWGLYNILHLRNRRCFKFVPYMAIDSECLFPTIALPNPSVPLPSVDPMLTVEKADKCIVFTDWAQKVINRTAKLLNRLEFTNMLTIPHGVDNSVWRPLDNRTELRQKYFNLDDKVLLVGCFLKDTPILMADLSYKPIQDIVTGDKVINHLGEVDEVVAPDPKQYEGDTYTITAHGLIEPITATQEHPFFAMKEQRGRKTETSNNIKFDYRKLGTDKALTIGGSWIKIKDLKQKDYIMEPIVKTTINVEALDTTVICSNNDKRDRNTLPEKIAVDNDFMRFLGLFVAEGSFRYQYDSCNKKPHYSSIMFSLNSNKTELIEFITNYAKNKLGYSKVNVRKTYRNNNNLGRITIELNGIHIANFILSVLNGDKRQTKSLKDWLLFLPVEKQLQFIRGWTEGNGCKTKDGRNVRVTTCKRMAQQAGVIFARAGIPYSIDIDKYESERNSNHSIRYKVTTWYSLKKQINIIMDGTYIYRRISKITKNKYKGTVYNFEVKNQNSYVVIQSAVHNSIARNQPRKRLDAVIQVLKYFKDNLEKDRKIMAYFHCSLEDRLGWPLTWLARYYGVEDRCIFDPRLKPGIGPTEEQLNEIVNCFDVHLSLTNSEGWHLPALETLAAGIPTIITNYSAHADWGKDALVLSKVAAYEHEPRTGFIKAIADIPAAAKHIKLISESPILAKEWKKKGLKLAKKLDWNNVIIKWEQMLDSIDLSDLSESRYDDPFVSNPSMPDFTLTSFPKQEDLFDRSKTEQIQ